MCLERLTVRNGSMIRNIFGLFSCKNQGKNGYFPVMYSNKRTGYAKDKNLRNSKKKKKEIGKRGFKRPVRIKIKTTEPT